ncbi:unnamed protein product [Caenorhabditis brenneri]
MAIPLFKLPALVIQLLLDIMGFVDIFVLTNASSKMNRVVRKLLKIRKCDMSLYMSEQAIFFTFLQCPEIFYAEQIFWTLAEGRPKKEVFYLKIGNMDHVPSEFSHRPDGSFQLRLHWNTNTNHGGEIYNTLNELFGAPRWTFEINLDGVSAETHRNWVIWFNDTLSTPFAMKITGKCSFLDYMWLLENVKLKNTLICQVEATDYSDNFGALNVDFTFKAEEKILITDGRWIKLQHLQSIEARKITIFRVSFTDSEINTFLRDWKDSKRASNMKKLFIFFEREANPEVVLEEMNATDENGMKPDNALNQWSFKMVNGEKCTVIYAEYEGNGVFGFEFQVKNSAPQQTL